MCVWGKRERGIELKSMKLDLQFFDYEIFHCPFGQEMCMCAETLLLSFSFSLSLLSYQSRFGTNSSAPCNSSVASMLKCSYVFLLPFLSSFSSLNRISRCNWDALFARDVFFSSLFALKSKCVHVWSFTRAPKRLFDWSKRCRWKRIAFARRKIFIRWVIMVMA